MRIQNIVAISILSYLFVVAAQAAPTRRALILGIDGLRGDALHRVLEQGGGAIGVQNLIIHGVYAKCPSNTAASCAKAHAGNDFQRDYVWKTGPGWGSVISGLDAKRHGIKNIDHKSMSAFTKTTERYPTIFTVAHDNNLITAASGVGAFLTSLEGRKLYPGITDYECGLDKDGPAVKANATKSCNLDFRKTYNNEDESRDNKITTDAVGWIKDPSVSLIMVVLDQVDAVGHKHGFDLSKEYLQAISDADKRVKAITDVIEERVKSNNESWLVVLTSDHGGHNQSKLISWLPINKGIHGTESGKDNIVPFIAAVFQKERFEGFNAMDNNVNHFDTFKTVATWLGFGNADTVKVRDGRSWVK